MGKHSAMVKEMMNVEFSNCFDSNSLLLRQKTNIPLFIPGNKAETYVGVQYILDSVISELDKDPNRR